MAISLSSREFNQDTGKAKKAAERGPVFITDRGRPAHVLLTIEDYRRLAGGRQSIAQLLAAPGTEEIELPIQPARDPGRAADFSG